MPANSNTLLHSSGDLLWVNFSVTIGQNIPANVPKPFEMPIRIDAYLGAISRWLTLKPEIAKPEKPTAKIKQHTATKWLLVLAIMIKNSASIPKPPQLNILRTWVVVKRCELRKLSAKCPPIGTMIVIIRWGKAPRKPDWMCVG